MTNEKELKEKVQHVTTQTKAKVEDIKYKTKVNVKEQHNKCKAFLKENPGKCLGIASVTGFVLGVFTCSLFKRAPKVKKNE
jgi:ElaB/YqjD/DUF883 family membrane-anchored ribosome-binding protein